MTTVGEYGRCALCRRQRPLVLTVAPAIDGGVPAQYCRFCSEDRLTALASPGD